MASVQKRTAAEISTSYCSSKSKFSSQQMSRLNKKQSTCGNADRDDLPAQDGRLCNRCQGIDIEEALNVTGYYPTGRFIMPLGEIREELEHSSCPLCRLFASVFVPITRRGHAKGGHHLRAFVGMAMVGLIDTIQVGLGGPGIALGVCRGLSDRKITGMERLECLARGFIAPISPQIPHPRAFQAQLVSKEKVNFPQIRAWLQTCQDTHDGTCRLRTCSLPVGFRCIDVNSREFREINAEEEYYALSYVWNISHPSTNTEDMDDDTRGLPLCGIPQVIEDAMIVVRELGGRYLWVDKFCINQKDPVQQQTQIQAMDRIYEGATVTIIAAPGKDSSPGLPGVSRCRMMQQPAEWVGDHLLVSTWSHISAPVAASIWVTRGWTYQEAVLSKRCLFFTDEQVYFLCRSTTSCESIAISPHTGTSYLRPRNFRNDALRINMIATSQNPKGLWEFFENLHHYKSRELSYESDSLDAFRGLLARSDFKNIWGVPIACAASGDSDLGDTALSIGFARGLWWENPGDNRHDVLKANEKYATYSRRPGFPSWSWAGWSGPTRVHKFRGDISSDTGCNEVDETSFDVQFWAELTSGKRISLSELCQATKEPDRIPPLSHNLHIETAIYKVRIRRHSKSNNPIPCICDCPLEDDQCSKSHATFTHNVRFFEDPTKDEYLSKVIFSQFWDIIPLFSLKDPKFPGSVASLIIDWDDDPLYLAQVRGVAYLHERLLFDKRRRAFRLR